MILKKQCTRYVSNCLGIILLTSCNLIGATFGDNDKDIWFALTGSFKPEMFYGKNINLLNDNNHADRVIYLRHTLDLKFDASFGKNSFGHNIIFTRFGARNRGIWGDPRSISRTTNAEVKISETVFGEHNHFIPRLFFWIREAWMELDLNDVLHWYTLSRHTFTLGAFKFELGRGIALGDAYATGPELLGFYTDSAVDQYAFGGKLTGDFIEDRLSYDIYTAILDNKSALFSDTAARILGQQYGCRRTPERGFGKVNYVVAGRLNWLAVNIPNYCTVSLEPYWLYNDQPEQKVEFLGDASSILGTLGVAGEYEGERFEFGFDYALNLGEQKVKGWDRNQIEIANYDGNIKEVNSCIIYQNKNNAQDPLNGKKFPYVPGSDAQTIIYNSPESEVENSKEIGTTTYNSQEITLVNAEDRFRDPYKNKYEGWMFVTDAGWWNKEKDLQAAVAFGFASGDNNPNEVTKDGIYSGFIGLQEIYSGKRVKSAFILGSSGKLKRPLSLPISRRSVGRFARTVSGFNNLIFTGGAIYWKPNKLDGKLMFHPNMIFYWQDMPTRGYDINTGQETNGYASKFLGTEFSIFMDYYLKPPLRLFFVGAVFIPGTHFSDIDGKPISAIQAKFIQERIKQLDRRDVTGFLDEYIPNISDDTAISFNIGLEYKF